jgi:hypothetical protein
LDYYAIVIIKATRIFSAANFLWWFIDFRESGTRYAVFAGDEVQ